MAVSSKREFVSKLGDLFRSWLRAAERIFHTLVGVLFLVFTFAGASVTFTEWESYKHAPSTGLVRLSLLAGFTILLFVCTLYSFLKARSTR